MSMSMSGPLSPELVREKRQFPIYYQTLHDEKRMCQRPDEMNKLQGLTPNKLILKLYFYNLLSLAAQGGSIYSLTSIICRGQAQSLGIFLHDKEEMRWENEINRHVLICTFLSIQTKINLNSLIEYVIKYGQFNNQCTVALTSTVRLL